MDIFRNHQFLRLWANQILLQLAFNMTNFAALILIHELTNSRFALSQYYVAMTIPAFLVGLFSGSIVDLYDRRRLMLVTDGLLAILFALMALSLHQYFGLVAIAFGAAAVAQFFSPAESATIPLLVKDKQLEHANSLFLFTGMGSVLLGYAIAGPVIDLFTNLGLNGFAAVFTISSLMMVVGFVLRLSLKQIDHQRPQVSDRHLIISSLVLIREAVQFVRTHHQIYVPIILLTLMEFNIGVLAILFLDFVQKYLLLNTTAISYFLVIPLVVGLAVGMIFLAPAQKIFAKGQLVFLASLTFALVVTLLGLLVNLVDPFSMRVATVVGALIVGIATIYVAVLSRTVLQQATPPPMQGRVFSLLGISAAAIAPLPVLVLAWVTEQVDVSLTMIGFGMVLLIVALFLYRPLRKAF